MRKIRFRGFHADENGKTVIKLDGKEIRGFWCYGDLHTDGPYINEHKVIPETVGQYTGIDDTDGREIFEGDILKDNTPFGFEFIYKVIWSDKYFCWQAKRVDAVCEFLNNLFRRELIGNIFENPELLEVDE